MVHYIPSHEDGFLDPGVGTSDVVYIIFCFGCGPAIDPSLLLGLLQWKVCHGCCLLSQRHNENYSAMEMQWLTNDKIGTTFYSHQVTLAGEYGSC